MDAVIESARGSANDSRVNDVVRGAWAGMVATVPMSAWMLVAQQGGFLGQAPPRKIVRRLLGKSRVPWGWRRDHRLTSTLGHFAFGAAAGALFGAVVPRKLGRPTRTLLGSGYGVAIWAAAYAWLLPALDLMPPPRRDRPGRPRAMLLAHVVFGAVLGALARRRPAPSPEARLPLVPPTADF
jgi:hypothetical protein